MPAEPLPTLETSTLLLRGFALEDAPRIFAFSQEDGMKRWMPSQVYRDQAHAASVLAFLASHYQPDIDPRTAPYVLGICIKATGELVGHVGLSPLQDQVEVGFAVAQAWQRQGLATAAVRLMCDWAANRFKLDTILGIAAQDNTASQGVLARAGFRRQAPTRMRFQGQEQAVVVFAR